MEQRKISVRQERMTPQAAQAILLHEMYEHQRPLEESVIQNYTLQHHNNNFRPNTLLSFCTLHGRRWLINGQHTLHAIVRAGKPLDVSIEEIAVESLAERAQWYGTYDRNKLRSLKDIYAAHAIHETLNFNKHQALCLSACLPLLAAGFAAVTRQQGGLRMYTANAQLRMAFMEAWIEEAEQFYAVIKGAPGSLSMNIRRAPVMAVALVTYRFTGTDAEDFWDNVVRDDGLAQGDPRKALHVFLRTSKTGRYQAHTYSRYIASAWNADWHNRKVKTIQPQPEHSPILIEGTPHTGKQVLRYITPQGTPLHDPLPYLMDQWQQAMLQRNGTADRRQGGHP
jgi:hypothetical protein